MKGWLKHTEVICSPDETFILSPRPALVVAEVDSPRLRAGMFIMELAGGAAPRPAPSSTPFIQWKLPWTLTPWPLPTVAGPGAGASGTAAAMPRAWG